MFLIVLFERENDESSDKYEKTEVFSFELPENSDFDLRTASKEDNVQSSQTIWDGLYIDEEMLMAEGEEADSIYNELRARSFRMRNLESQERRLSLTMKEAVDSQMEEEKDGRSNQAY